MANFMIRFLFCNLFICMIIGFLFAARRLFRNELTSRMRYHLWFLLFGLLAVPFVPIRSGSFPHLFAWIGKFQNNAAPAKSAIGQTSALYQSGTTDWMNDLTISVSQRTPSTIGLVLFILWIAGILVMAFFLLKARLRLNVLKKSALPLQNQEVGEIYRGCLAEMKIRKDIPVYSTAFLKSPVIVGLFRPCIYLPLHLISGYRAADMRYILLHELQHYKHKDALANYLMNLASVVYWFNPFVWFALKEMRNDREIACDTSVLKMLKEDAYEEYGSTLINFAEKISLIPFPFASGISGSMAQMQKRILNIVNYHPITFRKKLRGLCSYALIAVFLLGFVPVLSTQAANRERYDFNTKNKDITYLDLRTDFDGYEGSFVLYDTATDSWQIYNMEQAVTRIAPVSTYKIYIALAGLDAGVITPERSQISWNGQKNGIDTWNADQTLESAMRHSVNWYFQAIDARLGLSAIRDYVREIGYGNQQVNGDTASYWLTSSLKISPVEQVEMLLKLYHNELPFSPETTETVKNSICLFSTAEGSVYGKTGTEEADGR
ncbi:MAG: BlaR1 family beta-lactam sensor/signal transducer, partial [Lachnospiraceae bacterium]|nr:BlaR1 family beta-lactam sensor/signal transducer [Lachnospiraceae bacterium]